MVTPRTQHADAAVDVSVVVIGRNEGPRLTRCLASVAAARWEGLAHEVIYVDSQSGDDSVARAEAQGAQVRVLDAASPCAALARNVGWRLARGDLVLFLDGDTELDPAFVPQALGALRADPRCCAAWGHRRESDPAQSIYTRVLDLDWVYPTGRTLYFGGDVLVRRAALAEVGGFDGTLKAGEEPELCARLRAAGWHIEHLDVPMTRHDLAITTLRGWWRRAYRSGIAYAEVAERMRRRGDVLWQREAKRDLWHGVVFLAVPFVLAALALGWPVGAFALVLAGVAFVVRTAMRCRWKAPDRPWLRLAYAIHSHAQKIPALFGQLAFRRAQRRRTEIGLVEYKAAGAAPRAPAGGRRLKGALVAALVPLAAAWQRVVERRWRRVWNLARLQAAIGAPVDPTNVVLGRVDVHGTANIRLGRDALIYADVHLETQGAGRIEIGDGVVLSRGVHIVAFERVTLGDGAMIGEYASVRDANHRLGTRSVRDSGHDHAPVAIGRNAWIGRGAAVLKGATLEPDCVVAANAVVTRRVAAGTVVGGVPATLIRRAPVPRHESPARDAVAPVIESVKP
ncbi:MAG: glycosyltransferase [Burkholderiales bacterium]